MKQLFGIVVLALLLAGCTEKTEKVSIGWAGPLTGDYAIIGIENLRGVQLALDELNDPLLKLVVEDDQFDEKKTLTAYQKMRQTNDIAALLTVTYGGVLALGSQTETDQVIIIDSLDTNEEIAQAGEGAFGIGIYDEGIGYSLAEFAANDLKSQEAGILYNNVDPFVLLVVRAFEEKYKELTGKMPVKEQYTPEDKDFRTQLLKLKDADALLIIGFDEAGLALKQARQIGLKSPALAIDTSTSEGFKSNAGESYEGLYFTSWTPADKAAEAAFISKYKAKFGKEPDQLLFAATGYDAMHVLAKGLQNADYDALKQHLYSVKDYEGLTGTLTMSPDGISRSVKEEIHQIENGVPVKAE